MDFDDDDDTDPTKGKFGLLDSGPVTAASAPRDMKDWIDERLPGLPPVNTYYPPANGEKNGIKKQLEDAADAQRVLLFPVYDTARRHAVTTSSAGPRSSSTTSSSGPAKTTCSTGHFVTFIATDLAAGNPITDPDLDFGVHVITLTK